MRVVSKTSCCDVRRRGGICKSVYKLVFQIVNLDCDTNAFQIVYKTVHYIESNQCASKERQLMASTETAEQDIVQVIRERIANHLIPPGTKLVEAEMAEEFGVSRTRVREVLTELELRGLVRREPNRGAVVARLDLPEIFAIYDVREALEGMAVRLATLNTPPESWQYWVDQLRPGGPMQKFVDRGEIEAYFENYERMRRDIIEAAGNPVLTSMLDGILEKTRVIMRRVQILPGRVTQALEEHRAVLVAMRTGDPAEAERLRRENIRSAIATLKRFQQYVL
jgi:DNA-binding GntR family transcriptional regulator